MSRWGGMVMDISLFEATPVWLLCSTGTADVATTGVSLACSTGIADVATAVVSLISSTGIDDVATTGVSLAGASTSLLMYLKRGSSRRR